MLYKLIVSGGTFDLFHKGHIAFLNFQLQISEKILLGITSDKYFKNFTKHHDIESYAKRKKSVENFLTSENALSRFEIVPIDSPDPEGSTNLRIEALVITPETEKGAYLINQKRKERILPELMIIRCDLLTASDGMLISSTRIRNGEINREGKTMIESSWREKTLFLPISLRKNLKEPFGDLIKDNNYHFEKLDREKTITVGDIATKTLVERGIIPKISIVDLVVERKKKFSKVEEIGFADIKNLEKIKNPAGQITPILWSSIQKLLLSTPPGIIQIEGEEDLAVLPAILLVPFGWKIFYGQPGSGLVLVEVDEEIKKKAYFYLRKFRSRK